MNTKLWVLFRFYAQLLRLFPQSFRAEFGEEMSLDFMDTVNEASQNGCVALFLVLLKEIADFPFNLGQAYIKENYMLSISQPKVVHSVIRIAFGFGVTFLTYIFASGVSFFTQPSWIAFLLFLHSLGWQNV